MISASLEGRLPYMTYPEPWRGQPKQPPEFLRPAPKPVPPTSRFNGISTSAASTRLPPQTQRKYPSPTPTTPVNLTQQHKDEIGDELTFNHYRLFQQPPPFSTFPQFALYQAPYSHHMLRPAYPTTPLPPLETYSPTTPTAITSATFLSPSAATFSPPSPIKSSHGPLRDKRPTSQAMPTATQTQLSQHTQAAAAFKVPSGKEGSLKHRILTRPEDGILHRNNTSSSNSAPLDLQQKSNDVARRGLVATMSPPRSPKKPSINNNNSILENFAKGSLIQLANGDLRRIEDMRTEDFVSSADNCPELRLAESTVVKKEENYSTGTVTISLTYNQRRTQVKVESNVEHPFFVFGKGWSSCNPERTQKCYRLNVHRLEVGDILISLTPREQFAKPPASTMPASRSTNTIMTTATSTAMTIRQMSIDSIPKNYHEMDQPSSTNHNNNNNNNQMQPINLHTPTYTPSISPDSLAAARKRRWSAPDQICDEEEQLHPLRKPKLE